MTVFELIDDALRRLNDPKLDLRTREGCRLQAARLKTLNRALERLHDERWCQPNVTKEEMAAAAQEIELKVRGLLIDEIDSFTRDPTERGQIVLTVHTLAIRRYMTAFNATRKQRATTVAKLEKALMLP